jgi:hypothetical protein
MSLGLQSRSVTKSATVARLGSPKTSNIAGLKRLALCRTDWIVCEQWARHHSLSSEQALGFLVFVETFVLPSMLLS